MYCWRRVDVPSQPRANCVAAAVAPLADNRFCSVVFFGGTCQGEVYNDMHVLHVPIDRDEGVFSLELRTPSDPPCARAASAFAVLFDSNTSSDIVVVFGGISVDGSLLDDTHFLENGKEWERIVPSQSPCPRSYHSLCSISGDTSLLLFGGFDGSKALNDTWIFDYQSKEWECVDKEDGDVPPPRIGHTLCVTDESVLLFGGWNGKERLNDLYVFSTNEKNWEKIDVENGVLPPPRGGHTFCSLGENEWMVFGGDDGNYVLGDAWKLKRIIDEENEHWEWELMDFSEDMNFPSSRNGHICVDLGNGQCAVYGGDSGEKELDDVYVFVHSEFDVEEEIPQELYIETKKIEAELGVAINERKKAEIELESCNEEIERVVREKERSEKFAAAASAKLAKCQGNRAEAQSNVKQVGRRVTALQEKRVHAEKEVERLEGYLTNLEGQREHNRKLIEQIISHRSPPRARTIMSETEV